MKIKLPYGAGFVEGDVPDRKVIDIYTSKRDRPIKKEETKSALKSSAYHIKPARTIKRENKRI